jgi:predicted RNase H-like nuclease (RuvC/YqgF family)
VSSNALLTIVVAFLGGGTVPLIIFLFRRRAELRQLSTQSDVNTTTVYDTLIKRLQEDGATYRERVRELESKVDRLETRSQQAEKDFTRQLQDAHSENSRLGTRIAQLQVDLDISTRQVEELQRRIAPS